MKLRRLLHTLLILAVMAVSVCCGGDERAGNGNGNGGNPSVIIPEKGTTLYGFVGDAEGKPIPGVVVSDGYSVVETGSDGVYQMVRDAKAVHVFVSVPSGYEIPVQGGTYGSYTASYKPANKPNAPNNAVYRQDFRLAKMAADDNDFVLIAIGDPQPNSATEVGYFRSETVEDIKATLAAIDKPAVAISLGDFIGQNPTGDMYHRMKLAAGAIGVPFYTTIGNHDKTDGGKDAGEHFRDQMGPLWYSFNRGKVHFVSMDNIMLDGAGSYTMEFTAEQVEWLRKDLSFVPRDRMIVLYYHIPLRSNSNANTKAVLDLIGQYENAVLLCGHTHYFQHYTNPRINRQEHILGAACGYFWRSKVAGDGVPNGYVVYEFSGTRITNSRFKATRRDSGHQIRLFRGDADFGYGMKYDYGSDYMVANVFFANVNGSWTVELLEDGVLSGTMERISASDQKTVNDMWIRSYHHGRLGHNPTGYSPCHHLYRYRLKNPAAVVSVRATDSFGNSYEQSELTLPGDYSEAIGYE